MGAAARPCSIHRKAGAFDNQLAARVIHPSGGVRDLV
jgi:hypothetical protein